MRTPTLTIILLSICCYLQGQPYQNHIISSQSLDEDRLIQVRLPAGYHSSEKYGVLYVLDGEYIFDYAAGAVDFLSNAFGYMPPLIVVGIPNIDRLRDVHVAHNNKDGYHNFLTFVESELKPFIDKKYSTNSFDILYGWSSASDISMHFLAHSPELFDAHIQTGTGVGPKTATTLSQELIKRDYTNRYLYAGTEGTGPRAAGLEKYKALIEDIQPKNLKSKFELLPNSSHVDVLGDGIYRGLRFVFEEFYIPSEEVVRGVDAIKKYYSAVNENYDVKMKIPLGAIGESAGILFQNEKAEEAIELVKHGIKLHPHSSDMCGAMGELYEYLGETEQAAKYYQLAYQKATPKSAVAMKYKYLFNKFDSR